MGIHDGHRDRMRERFLTHGLLTFNEIEALELLLFYTTPQKDTNPLAHTLLKTFGSLHEVLNASEQQLCEVPGVGQKTAALLMLVPQIYRLSEVKDAATNKRIRLTREGISYLRPYFEGLRDEMLMMVCLDSANKVISTEVLSTGVVAGVRFDTRQLLEIALKRKSTSVLLAHNHPDGQARPSREDDISTECIYKALRTLDIELFDHIIFAGENEYSYRAKGVLDILAFR